MENAARTLFVNDPNQKTGRFTRIKSELPRILFIILAVVIAVEVVLAVKKLIAPVPTMSQNSTKEVDPVGKMFLSAMNKPYKVGETISVSVVLSSGTYSISGADAVLSYDPAVLEASNSSFEKSTTFSEYPEISIKDGKVIISAIVGLNQSKGLVDKLGTIKFKALKSAKTKIMIDYSPQSTTDSNITESEKNQDILGDTTDLELSIN